MQPRPPAGSGRGDWSELAQACQSEQAGQVARQVGARATPFVRAQPPTDRPASGQQAARERTCNTASPEGAHPPHLPTGPLSAGAGVKRGVGSHLRGGALSARRPGPPSAKALLLYAASDAGKKNQQFYCIVETARCAGRLRLDSPHLRDGSCKGRSLSRQPRPLLSCYVTCACARSAPSMHHLASPRMRTSKAFDRLGPREIAWLVLRWLLRWPLRGSSTRKLITPTAAPNPLT